jgi:hypothetical protein
MYRLPSVADACQSGEGTASAPSATTCPSHCWCRKLPQATEVYWRFRVLGFTQQQALKLAFAVWYEHRRGVRP